MISVTNVCLWLYAISFALSRPTGQLKSRHEDYRWVAIGDIYSAGPGAESDYDEEGTRIRTKGSYSGRLQSTLINNKLFNEPDLNLLSHAGAKIIDIISDQLPHVHHKHNLVTLSIGDNSVGFAGLLVGDTRGFYSKSSTCYTWSFGDLLLGQEVDVQDENPLTEKEQEKIGVERVNDLIDEIVNIKVGIKRCKGNNNDERLNELWDEEAQELTIRLRPTDWGVDEFEGDESESELGLIDEADDSDINQLKNGLEDPLDFDDGYEAEYKFREEMEAYR